MAALASAAKRGVHVQVCLDLGTDRETGEIDHKHETAQAWLATHGVRVVLDEARRTTHAKVMVVDERTVALGSHNWTRSAMTTNREASLTIDDPEIGSRLMQEMARIPGWDPAY
jgi:phosphatidylserine/phosphatidylglycerophosphate/cardiolipin synthase-like enzyme